MRARVLSVSECVEFLTVVHVCVCVRLTVKKICMYVGVFASSCDSYLY